MVKTWTEEAREQGELKGKREVLLDQLEFKFPGLSQSVRQRVAELPVEKLKELWRGVVAGKSLRELGLED